MASIKFSLSFLLITFCLFILNAPYVRAQTFPGALQIGEHYLSKAKRLKGDGTYTFYNVHTSSFLRFTSTGNIVNPGPYHQTKPTEANYFTVKLFGGKNYTIQKENAAHHVKCLTVAWFVNDDNTAMMYACAPEFLKRSFAEELTNLEDLPSEGENFNQLAKREIRRDKVEWVFLPISGYGANVYLVVSTVHMWNQYPVCLADTRSGSSSKHAGMQMLNCPRRLDKRFLWKVTKV